MRRIAVLVMLCGGFVAGNARALDLGNVHVSTGPLGSKRTETKFLPGDVLFVNFEIRDLLVDPNVGTVAYDIKMEIFDSKDKEVFTQIVPPKKLSWLGGTRLPTFAVAILSPDQDPGAYRIKITVRDVGARKEKEPQKGKEVQEDKTPLPEKSFTYEFEVLPVAFGLIQPAASAVSFAGLDYGVSMAVVGFKRGKVLWSPPLAEKPVLLDKMPDVVVSLQVLDEANKAILPKAVTLNLQELHDPMLNDLTQSKVIQVGFPLFLNRSGRFTIVIEAEDKLGKQKKELRLPLRVLNAAEPAVGS